LRYYKHLVIQKLCWNPIGARIVQHLTRYGVLFDTVVRGYSLMSISNGERWLASLIDAEPIIFDVGFHDGASTESYLGLRPQAQIHAFDPSRFAQEHYQAKFSIDTRVHFSSTALSNAPGEAAFYDYENMCNSLSLRKESRDEKPSTYTVPVTTLDAYCAANEVRRIHFMKIDAEGYDLHVLEGAQELLGGERIDLFAFEFASGWAATKRYLWEAVELFDNLPYQLFRLYNGFLCPLVYDIRIDSCTTRPCMYVGVSNTRLARGDIPLRNYRF